MESKFYPVKKQHYEVYKKEVKRWLKVFGLVGWRVYFRHEDIGHDILGMCTYDLKARNACFWINELWPETDPSVHNVKRTAFHEVCELLFARLNILAMSRFVVEDEIEEERHNLIRKLETVVFEKDYKK